LSSLANSYTLTFAIYSPEKYNIPQAGIEILITRSLLSIFFTLYIVSFTFHQNANKINA